MDEDEAIRLAGELAALRSVVSFLLRPTAETFTHHANFSKHVHDWCDQRIAEISVTTHQHLLPRVQAQAREVLDQIVDSARLPPPPSPQR